MLRRLTVVAAAVAALTAAATLPASAAQSTLAPPSTSSSVVEETIIDVTPENYADVMELSKEKPVVLGFTADWCYWCQQQKPYLEEYNAADDGSWIWARVDVDVNPDISKEWGVSGIPALLNIQDTDEAGSRQVGFDGPESLRTWLNSL